MTDWPLPEFGSPRWPRLGHREVTSRLIGSGWTLCGIGDWAVVLRSPDGCRVARVSPFDVAQPAFLELCERLGGHRLLPRIWGSAALSGGARLTLMEHLRPASTRLVESVRAALLRGTDAVIAHEAAQVNADAAARYPYWRGLDLHPGNVMQDEAGQPKVVDVFSVDRNRLIQALLRDPEEFRRTASPSGCDGLPDVPFLSRIASPKVLALVHRAATR